MKEFNRTYSARLSFGPEIWEDLLAGSCQTGRRSSIRSWPRELTNLTPSSSYSDWSRILCWKVPEKKVAHSHTRIVFFSKCILCIVGCEGRICAWLSHKQRKIFEASFAFEVNGMWTLNTGVESRCHWV